MNKQLLENLPLWKTAGCKPFSLCYGNAIGDASILLQYGYVEACVVQSLIQ